MNKTKMRFFTTLIVAVLFCQGFAQNTQLTPDISDIEITPKSLDIYAERQKKLLDQIENGIIVINSNSVGYTGGRHGLKVANYFYYLTGITENDCALMLSKNDQDRYSVFYPERDIIYRTFSGEPIEKEKFKDKFNIDRVLDYSKLDQILEEKIREKLPIFIDFNDIELKNHLSNELGSKTDSNLAIIKNIVSLIAEMRVNKDVHEITRLQKAIDITGKAFENVCKSCKPEMYEFEMEAIIDYNFQKYGAVMPGFTSIVGSGENSTILHYMANNKRMKSGELLLMDIGAEYDYYTADISRTIPVNKKFSPEQKEIYELVLKAQKAAISEMKIGNFINSGHFKANEILISGLVNMGLITDPEKEWQRKFYILYPASHYLGMNCHDVGNYGSSMMTFYENRANGSVIGRKLEQGMVLTIEPGLYFRENGLKQLYDFFGSEASKEEIDAFVEKVAPVYKKYINIGIRIEDDILITESGNQVLSQKIPKEIADIEKLMRK